MKNRGRKLQGKTEFSRLLMKKGLSLKEFCEKWGINYRSALQYSYGGQKTPKIFIKILENM